MNHHRSLSSIAQRAFSIVDPRWFNTRPAPEALVNLDLVPPSERQYVLRMPVVVNGGEAKVPEDLTWLKPLWDVAIAHQERLGVRHAFAYVTVRHGEVTTKTDDEWHVDGFSTRITHLPEQNYVWCDHTPTEWMSFDVEVPMDLDPLRHNVNWFLKDYATNQVVHRCEPKRVYVMDPYVLHRRPDGLTGVSRTFVRLSFVPIEIADIRNTPNPLLPRTSDRDGLAFRASLQRYGR